MPGKDQCPLSASNRRTVYQKAMDRIRFTHHEYYNRAVEDGWYASALAFHKKLKVGNGLPIMTNFEEVATRYNIGKKESTDLKDYLVAYTLKDDHWKLLNDFESFFARNKEKFPEKKRWQQWDYYMSKVGESIKIPGETLDNIRDLAIREEGFTRTNFDKILEAMDPKDVITINRFAQYAKDQGFSDSFLYYLKKANNPNGFIIEAMSHESYMGFLDDMYKNGDYNRIKSATKARTTDDVLLNYVVEKVTKTFPEITDEGKRLALAKKLLLIPEKVMQSDSPFVNTMWAMSKEIMNSSRILSTMLRFTVGVTSGVLMLGQNFFTNGMQYKGITKGMSKDLLEHKLVDQLMKMGYFKVAKDYETYRALYISTDKETLVEKAYNATVHKAIYFAASHLPYVSKELANDASNLVRDITLTGMHNLQDYVMARHHLRAGVAQAIISVWGDNFDEVLKGFESGMIPEEQLNKFITKGEYFGQSGNNAFVSAVMQKNKFSNGPWAVFNYLSNYHVQRLGEFQYSLKKLTDAFANGEIKSAEDFRKHLWQENPELRKAISITLDTMHLGFFVDTYYDKESNNNPAQYAKLFHEYANSLQASFMGRMFMSILGNNHDLKVYQDVTGKEISTLAGIPVQVLKFVDDLVPMMFREFDWAKNLPQVLRSFQEGDARTMVALRREALDKMMNGSYRFNMPEGIDQFGQMTIPEEDDIIGLLGLGMYSTNATAKLAEEMFNVDAIDKFIKSDNDDDVLTDWSLNALRGLPLIEIAFANNMPAGAQWAALKQIRDNDPIVRAAYGKENDVFARYINQYNNDPEKKASEVKEFFTDITDFNYEQWNKEFPLNDVLKKQFYNKTASYDYLAKEELFTEILKQTVGEDIIRELDLAIEGLPSERSQIGGDAVDQAIISRPTVKESGIQKLIMMGEAKTPGSARVIISYLASKEFYKWKLDNAPKGSISGKDQGSLDTSEAGTAKMQEIVEYYHPYMYYADKPAYLKVIRNQLKNQYPEVFSTTNDSMKQFVNGLMISDFAAHREALSGQPSAGNIASIVANTNRYMKSDADKIAAMNYKIERIDNLHGVDPEVKEMVKVGLLYPNTDIIHRLWQDDVFRGNPNNERMLQYATNFLYGTVDDIAFKGSNIHALTEKDFDDGYSGARSSSAGKKFYKQYTGSDYSQKPSNTTNASLQDRLLANANKYGAGGARQYYQPNTTSFSRSTPREYSGYTPEELYSFPRPRVLDTMIRIGRSEGVQRIISPTLLKQTVRRSVLSEEGTYRRPSQSQYKKRIPKARPSISPIRTPKIKKRGPNVQLPGGTINVG